MHNLVTYCSIVYWRRSRWNGARCEPLLMILQQQRLRVYGRDQQVLLDASPAEVSGRLSRLGTLIMTVRGQNFELVGRGGASAPSPSPSQLKDQADFWTYHQKPAPTSKPGVFDTLLNGGARWRMKSFRDALRASGARIT